MTLDTQEIFTIQFEIHNNCNLRCIHCYQSGERQKSILDIKGIKWFFDQIKDFIFSFNKRPQVIFRVSGGEPLTNNNIYLVLLYAFFLHNYQTCLLTNATIIDSTIAKKLFLTGLPIAQVSFDSIVPKIYEYIRGQGTFMCALRGIKLLQLAEKHVQIAITLLKGINDNHFDTLFSFCSKNNINVININRFFPQGQSKNAVDFLYIKDEFKEVLAEIIETGAKYPELFIVIKDPLVKVFFKNLPKNIFAHVCCYIGKNFMAISADGSVYACRKLDIKIGDMKEKSLKEIWTKSKTLKQLINREKYLKDKCTDCSEIALCKGGCMAASYNISKTKFEQDPCCWK